MKTLYKTYTMQQQARTKQIELESKTSVKWDFYHIGDGYKFTPVITLETPISDTCADELLGHLSKDYTGFVTLSEISGLSLADVLSGAKTLAKHGKAVGSVNRMGNFASIRKAK